jgi:hypothetical protein
MLGFVGKMLGFLNPTYLVNSTVLSISANIDNSPGVLFSAGCFLVLFLVLRGKMLSPINVLILAGNY